MVPLADEFSFVKCPREINRVAHVLARVAAGFWPNFVPSSVVEGGFFGQVVSSMLEDSWRCVSWVSHLIEKDTVVPIFYVS